ANTKVHGKQEEPMPVYVYRNLVTNETFEYQQRITEDALTVDPRTGDPVRRVIQPVGIAFKGSGFYVNDSRNSGSSSAGSEKSSAISASSGTAESAGATKSSAEGSAGGSGSDKSGAGSTGSAATTGDKSGSKSGGQSGSSS